jgi:hypothetical protein
MKTARQGKELSSSMNSTIQSWSKVGSREPELGLFWQEVRKTYIRAVETDGKVERREKPLDLIKCSILVFITKGMYENVRTDQEMLLFRTKDAYKNNTSCLLIPE